MNVWKKSSFYILPATLLASVLLSGSPSHAQQLLQFSKPEISPAPVAEISKLRRIPTAADDAATTEVLNGLLQEAGWFPELKIRVSKGLVLIEGRVQDQDHLKWLVNTADRLPSVIAVVNKAELVEAPVSDLSPAMKELKRMVDAAKKRLPIWGLGAVLILGFGFASRFLSRLAKRSWSRHVDNPFLVSIISFATLIPLYAIMLYLTLATLGLSGLASTIIGGTGLLGIVLGFAFKGIAENFLSGMLLAIRSPFTKGDTITVGEYTGTVQNLNMRGTTIMDPDGNLVLIPNAIIIQSVVKNSTANPKTRSVFSVGIGYCESMDSALAIIYEALKKIPEILSDPEPLVVADALSPSVIKVNIYYWVDAVKFSAAKIKSQAVVQVKSALLDYGVDLPDETREVILKKERTGFVKRDLPPAPPKKPAPELQKMDNSHEESLKRMTETAHLPGNDQTRDLLKPAPNV